MSLIINLLASCKSLHIWYFVGGNCWAGPNVDLIYKGANQILLSQKAVLCQEETEYNSKNIFNQESILLN